MPHGKLKFVLFKQSQVFSILYAHGVSNSAVSWQRDWNNQNSLQALNWLSPENRCLYAWVIVVTIHYDGVLVLLTLNKQQCFDKVCKNIISPMGTIALDFKYSFSSCSFYRFFFISKELITVSTEAQDLEGWGLMAFKPLLNHMQAERCSMYFFIFFVICICHNLKRWKRKKNPL